jgi:tetratricopeptide (TPR) repeat protein
MSTGTKTMPEPSNPIINKEWVANLENYLDQANLDGAFEYIAKLPPENLEQHFDPQLGPLLSLRARCLVCEVYDYAGKSREANLAIDAVAEDIWEDLKAAEPTKAKVWKNIEKLTYLKQECLACLHLGMVVYYRKHDYQNAFGLFSLAEQILSRINSNDPSIPSMGSLARAYYCLGLAEREQHKLYDARRHFSQAVECAWTRLVEQQQMGKRVAFLRYIIGRALGLGMSWIAFARASMAEANAHIVAARLILQETAGVKYLRDYVEVVHACTQRSRATTIGEIDVALNAMKDAYESLGGNSVLKDHTGQGHFIYAQRAACELATSHIYAARLHGQDNQKAIEASKHHLKQASEYVLMIERSLLLSGSGERDTRTRCNVLIAKSRIFREMGRFSEARAEAEKAVQIADNNPFSRIDCWTTLGEAYYHLDEIDNAFEQFRKARNDSHAQTNPKVLAVCDLQIALCHLKRGQVNQAQEIVVRWKSQGSQGRANAFVQYLLAKIEIQLSEPPFVIPGNTADNTLKDWIPRAEKWLAQVALKRADGNKVKAGELLGVHGKTVSNYLNQETDGSPGDPPGSE